jgi:spore coat protein H
MLDFGKHARGPACRGLALAIALGWAALGLGPGAGVASPSSVQHRAEADTLFTNNTILRLSLEVPEAGLATLRQQTRRLPRPNSVELPREYVRATLREGNTTYSNVAVHLKGSAGSFREVGKRPGLTLNFTHLDADGPRFHGLKKIHLNNSVQDPTCLNEWMGGQLFREAGVPAARVAHALLELNGERQGLYVIVEAMNRDFLSLYFKNPKGNLYGQSAVGDVNTSLERMEGSGPITREDLRALTRAVAEPDPKLRVARLEKTLDVDRFLSFTALELILCHWDSYTLNIHNYRIYQDVDTGRMVFFPHDMDQLFIRQNLALTSPSSAAVVRAVRDTPELEARFQQRYRSLATNLFNVPRLTGRVDRVVAALLPTLAAYDPNTARTFSDNATALKNRIASRALTLQRDLAFPNGAEAPRFQNGVARLGGWWPDTERRLTRLEQVRDKDGRLVLWISAAGQTAAAWHAQVLLEAGRYRFEGLARCAGVATNPRRREGAGLMVPGLPQGDLTLLTGDSAWQKLSFEFELRARLELQLDCGLRALKGEAWFDVASLQLRRLP